MSRRRSAVIAAIVSLLASLAPIAATPAAATYPGANGRVVFAAATEPWTLYTINGDGTDLRPLLSSVSTNYTDPVYSPDGSMVAFRVQTSFTQWRLYVMRSDGTGAHQVTPQPIIGPPSWSPDGRRIAFGGSLPGGTEVFTVRLDGTGLEQLTNADPSSGYPQWSPDGDRIVYYSSAVALTGPYLFAMDPDGSNKHQISPDVISGFAYAPNGDTLAIGKEVDGNVQVHLMPENGGAATQITTHNSGNRPRSFSPDGSRIVFTSTRDSDFGGVYTMKVDGSDTRPLWSGAPTSGVDWGVRFFADAGASIFRADIAWALAEGITTGCAPDRYCPDAPITRAQMASFLARALALPPTAVDFFTDDESSIHEADINRVAAAGITSGCATNRYCPGADVSRQEMASFLVRAFHVPASTQDSFTDDESSIHEADINALAASGIASGCGDGRFCPRDSVTRGQMAAFLHRAMT